jgi:AcrR family transcriptional regulator
MTTFEMATRKRKKDAYHHGDLRRTLLDLAFAHVEREGVDTLSLRELAREAGVSNAAPYRHFPTRDALIAAMAEEGFARLRQMLVDATSDEPDPLERFCAQGEAFIGFASAYPAHYRVMFSRRVPRKGFPGLAAAGQAAMDELVEAIGACQKKHQLRRGEPERLAIAAWAMVHGMATLLVDGRLDRERFPEKTHAALIREVVQVVARGLAPQAAE